MWALVPPAHRARYLRRAARAVLDDLDGLARLLAEESGQPRTEATLAELLPSVGGLHGLADDGPKALADRRLGKVPALRAGRRSTLVQAPLGTVGLVVRDGSAWAGPLLEAAAALLAGNAVRLEAAAPRAAARMEHAFMRAGLPDGLFATGATGGLEHVVALQPPAAKGTMLLLEGAPLDRAVTGALWAAFAGAGRRPAALGRAIAPRAQALALAAGVEAAARRLRVGDPRDPETEVGPLASPEDAARVEALVAAAERDGATRMCGGPVEVAGVAGAFYAPVVLRGVPAGAALLREPVPGPVLAVVEAAGEAEAVALAAGEADDIAGSSGPDGALSVWAGDPARGERVARALGAPIAWVNEHGVPSPAAPVRLARYVQPRQIASQPTRLRSARWLPYDPALVRAATATAQLVHGREADRWPALRADARPLARTAIRLAREALGR
jgi:acyl-CoA reductase-like NAD-dependent aldehyde dehydrogenase